MNPSALSLALVKAALPSAGGFFECANRGSAEHCGYFPRQSRWFAEGMAQYLETYQWLDAETLRLGDPNLQAYRSYRAIRSLSVDEMLAWNSMDDRDLKVAGSMG